VRIPCEPLFFSPRLIQTIWGGDLLRTLFNKATTADVPIGESWEISGLEPEPSTISAGPLAGQTIDTIYKKHAAELVGRQHHAAATFPLLVKFIDAKEPLSVQVHPNDEQAHTLFSQPYGKTECWYIVHAGRNARICAGFKHTITPEELRESVATGTIEDHLDTFPVTTGEVYFIPAGKVHAILGDVLIYEVQQSSNTTLRLYDWQRTDATGTPRTLHIDDAIAVATVERKNNGPTTKVLLDDTTIFSRSLRVACPYFAMEEYRWKQSAEIGLSTYDSCRIVTMIEGEGTLFWNGGEAVLKKGATSLLPASLSRCAINAVEGSVCLQCFIPDMESDIIAPLQHAGLQKSDIAALGGMRNAPGLF